MKKIVLIIRIVLILILGWVSSGGMAVKAIASSSVELSVMCVGHSCACTLRGYCGPHCCCSQHKEPTKYDGQSGWKSCGGGEGARLDQSGQGSLPVREFVWEQPLLDVPAPLFASSPIVDPSLDITTPPPRVLTA